MQHLVYSRKRPLELKRFLLAMRSNFHEYKGLDTETKRLPVESKTVTFDHTCFLQASNTSPAR
ncbi:hypothetical protein [Paraburkholderia caledonica]|uniref:Uncharacterized protein n=1 Tax=Paraburkholderia caledonica TaxID=134536 RepID=A0ABU1KZ28_9BURK|nr:hypothetical protein [Paraburkholderia caledonica]MDR6376225.1 hypothetical protein [Paraburkholderia caledonica]